MNNKINKLGLFLAIIYSIVVLTISYFDSLNFSRGFGVIVVLMLGAPTTFIAIPIAFLIENILKPKETIFMLIPTLAVIFGGLQWYGIGWTISKLKYMLFKKINTGSSLYNKGAK